MAENYSLQWLSWTSRMCKHLAPEIDGKLIVAAVCKKSWKRVWNSERKLFKIATWPSILSPNISISRTPRQLQNRSDASFLLFFTLWHKIHKINHWMSMFSQDVAEHENQYWLFASFDVNRYKLNICKNDKSWQNVEA